VDRKIRPECWSAPTRLCSASARQAEWGGCSVVAKHYRGFVPATALVVAILISFAVSSFAGGRTTRLNEDAYSYAQGLIAQGHVVFDKRNDWGDHHAAAQEENDFIRDHGFAEYSKWHLGIDATHVQSTKARFKFPFGDFKNIHRCALLAAKNRASQYHYDGLKRAATELAELISSQDHSKPNK